MSMNHRDINPKGFITTSPNDLVKYLELLGWAFLDEAKKDGLFVANNPDFPSRQINFPMDKSAIDYVEAVQLSLVKIAELHNKSIDKVLCELYCVYGMKESKILKYIVDMISFQYKVEFLTIFRYENEESTIYYVNVRSAPFYVLDFDGVDIELYPTEIGFLYNPVTDRFKVLKDHLLGKGNEKFIMIYLGTLKDFYEGYE